IALILGITALIRPVPVRRSIFRMEIPILLGSSLLMVFFLWNDTLTRFEGGILLALLLIYSMAVVRKSPGSSIREQPLNTEKPEPETLQETPKKVHMFLGVIVGLALLMVGSKAMITGSVALGEQLSLSHAVIGLSIVAIGTSLPELATAFVAALRKENELILGGIIGSNIMNILFILGVTAIIKPLGLEDIQLIDLAIMIGLTLILWPFFYTGKRLCRKEGTFLLLVFAGYLFWLFVR
ncbi:sodium:calcium antiporter, partial [Balneolaceae bacterium ANBcel3]|nr:sodium:calcium antiporter [Balneolaceae bacterium ANBcel3]